MLGVKSIHPANSGPDILLLLLKALISISAPILSNKTYKLSIEFFNWFLFNYFVSITCLNLALSRRSRVAPKRTLSKCCLKLPLRQYWLMSLNVYSDWQLYAIQIDLTPLTLSIRENSAKQFVINPLYTGISMIRLLREGWMYFMFRMHIPRYHKQH